MHTKLVVRQQMKISPQLVITGKFLQIPGYELEQFINREMESNPALDLVRKPRLQPGNSSFSSTSPSMNRSTEGPKHTAFVEEFLENLAQRPSPLERLIEQVMVISDKYVRDIVLALLHRLDHRGYLVVPNEQLVSELGASNEDVQQAIQVLHNLEPPGIGARDIRDCFLIQCTYLEGEGIDCQQVRQVLTLAWDEFLNGQWARVAKKIGKPKRIVEQVRDFMRRNFCPYPLGVMETPVDSVETLNYADLIIRRSGPTNRPVYSLELPGAEDLELRISTSFARASRSEGQEGLSLAEKTWIHTQVDRALMAGAALRQRWETLRRIGEYLIDYQRDFLEHGRLHLKPLTQAMLAGQLNMRESTISRAVRDKIVQIPDGHLIPLSDFFDSSLAVKEAIRLLIGETPGRLCDREITEGLRTRGMQLSRRTVTKYRREIDIGLNRRQAMRI